MLHLLSSAAVYGGSKAFVDAFSRSLDAEYAPLGVRVQNQSPMFVATKMSKIRCAAAAWLLGGCLDAGQLCGSPWLGFASCHIDGSSRNICLQQAPLSHAAVHCPLAAGARGWMPPPPPPGRPRRSSRLGGRPASLPTGSTACRCACRRGRASGLLAWQPGRSYAQSIEVLLLGARSSLNPQEHCPGPASSIALPLLPAPPRSKR